LIIHWQPAPSPEIAVRSAPTAITANLTDCDGEAVLATRDIGADEFIDSDGDGLPDWIELQAGIDLNATDDNDLDLLNNLEDYENMGNPVLRRYRRRRTP
jgi:hypothetical protein